MDTAQQWWDPHPLDKYGQMFLLDIADGADPPSSNPDWWGDVILPSRDGWKVCFFYDCGELDHIHNFVAPTGEILDVWPDEYRSDGWPPIMEWGGPNYTDSYRLRLMEDGPSEDWQSLPINKIIAWLQAE